MGLAALWLLMRVTPALVESIVPLRDYARVVNETGITPGALYYTDVAQSIDSEFNNRDAIRYLVGKEKK
jgi:hypothetical protein